MYKIDKGHNMCKENLIITCRAATLLTLYRILRRNFKWYRLNMLSVTDKRTHPGRIKATLLLILQEHCGN